MEKIKRIPYSLVYCLYMQASALWSGRIALFVIYGWFGLLKMAGYSPAEGLVTDLFQALVQWSGFTMNGFVELFGAFEVVIGVAFLVCGPRTWVVRLFLAHMLTTALPLVVLPSVTWQAVFVPTLIGQYIIKNIALLSLVKFMRMEERA